MSESKQRNIVPAKSLQELYNNLEAINGLSEANLAFYVPLFENNIKRLESYLKFSSAYNDTFYLLGQTGTGKTTVVDFLFSKSESIKEKYVFLDIDFLDQKASTDYYDPAFHSIELFLIIFTKVYEVAEKYLDKDELNKIITKLEGIEEKQNIAHIDTASNKWSFGHFLMEGVYKLGLGWNVDFARRETVRKLFQNSVKEIIDLLNELIAKTQQKLPDNKALLLFLDGLEKLRSAEVINKIFNKENSDKFRQIQCRKLIVKPIDSTAQFSNVATDANRELLICTKIFENPLDSQSLKKNQKKQIKDEFDRFKNIVTIRIDSNYQNLINPDVLELAIQKSGGLINDYLNIVKSAIINADVAGSNTIQKEHVEDASRDFEVNKSLTFSADSKAIKLLYHVLQNNTCPDDPDLSGDVFLRQVLINNIIIGKNGVLCYYIHPLIEKTVKMYGQPRTE